MRSPVPPADRRRTRIGRQPRIRHRRTTGATVGFRGTDRKAPLSFRALGFQVPCLGVYSRSAQDCALLRSLMRYSGIQVFIPMGATLTVCQTAAGEGRAGCYPKQLRQGRNVKSNIGAAALGSHAVAYIKAYTVDEAESMHVCVDRR